MFSGRQTVMFGRYYPQTPNGERRRSFSGSVRRCRSLCGLGSVGLHRTLGRAPMGLARLTYRTTCAVKGDMCRCLSRKPPYLRRPYRDAGSRGVIGTGIRSSHLPAITERQGVDAVAARLARSSNCGIGAGPARRTAFMSVPHRLLTGGARSPSLEQSSSLNLNGDTLIPENAVLFLGLLSANAFILTRSTILSIAVSGPLSLPHRR